MAKKSVAASPILSRILMPMVASMLVCACGAEEDEHSIQQADEYRVQTQAARTPEQVVGVYFIGSDVSTAQIDPQWQPKLQTALESARTFYGDQMALAGFPGKTFYAQTPEGRPLAALVRGTQPQRVYTDPHRGARMIQSELRRSRQFSSKDTLFIVSPGITPDNRRRWAFAPASVLHFLSHSEAAQQAVFCDPERGPVASGQLGQLARALGQGMGLRPARSGVVIMHEGTGTAGYGRHFVDCRALSGLAAPALSDYSAYFLSRRPLFAGVADLVIQDFTVDTRFQQRARVNADVTVCNAGSKKSGAVHLGLYLSDEAPAADAEANVQKRVKALNPGDCKTVSLSIQRIPLEETWTMVWARVDWRDTEFEDREDNNLSAGLPVAVIP